MASDQPDSLQTPDKQQQLRHLAEQAARAGGQLARQYFTSDYQVQLKADHSEVSDADHAAQAAVIATIRRARPHDALIAEETLHFPPDVDPPPPPGNDVLCWVIDPIDGTRNFVRRIPCYTCSVAAMFGGYPLVGAIYEPERDRLYSASRAEGLFIDAQHQPTRPPAPVDSTRERLQPVVGLPSNPCGPAAAIAHAWLDRFVCRNFGSTALHLALISGGQLDGMLADNPRLWDLAAGWVLVTSVGGQLVTPETDPVFPVDTGAYAGQKLPTVAGHADFVSRFVADTRKATEAPQ